MFDPDDLKKKTDVTEEAFFEEVKQAREKWGSAKDDRNLPSDWVAFISHYASRELVKESKPYSSEWIEKFRNDMLRVAAIAFSAAKSIDRQRRNGNGVVSYEDPYKR